MAGGAEDEFDRLTLSVRALEIPQAGHPSGARAGGPVHALAPLTFPNRREAVEK